MTAYYEQIVRNIRPALFTLVGAVSFVLQIGCANLANLTLAKVRSLIFEISPHDPATFVSIVALRYE